MFWDNDVERVWIWEINDRRDEYEMAQKNNSVHTVCVIKMSHLTKQFSICVWSNVTFNPSAEIYQGMIFNGAYPNYIQVK